MRNSGLSGVVVPMVTPLTSGGECDVPAVRRLVERLVAAGVNALMAAGTSGEALALDHPVRHRLVETVCEAAAGRVPVMVGIGGSCLEEILSHSQQAAEAGANLVSLHPPPYFPMDENSIRRLFETVIEKSKAPMALYTIPSFAGNALTPDVVESLCADSKVVALKDSTGDAGYRREVIERCAAFGVGVLGGDEMTFVDAARDGVIGFVPSTANLVPGNFVKLWALCKEERFEEAIVLQRELNQLVISAKNGNGGWLTMMRWLKASLAKEGVCESYLATMFDSDPVSAPVKN